MTVSPFSIVTIPFWRKLARKPSGSSLSATSFGSNSLSSLKATCTLPSKPESAYLWARRYKVVSVVDQPGTSTDKAFSSGCVVSRITLNVTWDIVEEVRDDRRSSLVGVGRQSEVTVNAIRWREAHELRTKGVGEIILPPTKEIVVR